MQKSLKSSVFAGCCPIVSWSKPRQVGGLRGAAHPVSVSCCPIEVGQLKESEAVPNNASNDSKETAKTMRPVTLEGDKPKQDIKQHGGPQLPAYGVLGVTKEVAYFEGLLDLLEEGLNAPSASIQITDTGSSPVKVVGQEDHGGPFAVDLDPGFDSAQASWILSAGLVGDQSDLVVSDNIAFRAFQVFPADTVAEVVLGPCDPEDTASGQIEEIGKMNVGFVEDRDLSDLKPGAELHGAGVVMVRCLLDDGEGRKESLQVQAKMHLGRCLAAAVFGPVHTVGHQSDGRRVDRMDRPFESAGQAAVAARWPEAWTKRLKVSQDAPKQLFHHIAVAVLVRVRERVAAWRNRTTDRCKFWGVVPEAVTDIVQPNRVGQLRKQKTDHVAPRSEGPGLFVHAMLAGKFFRQVRRDEFTKLMQCAAVVLGRRYLFHAMDSLVGIRRRPPFLSELKTSSQLHPVG